jgi:hypothetical protein
MASPERTTFFHGVTYSWPAILAGLVASLVVQMLLTMLGIGVGLLTLDAQAAGPEPLGVSWAAFLWWAISGIVAAFVGGWVAGAASIPGSGRANGLAAWALATVIVTAAAALGAGTTASIASNLAGPTTVSIARLDSLSREARGQGTARQQRPAAGQQQLESARKAVAWGMLAGFVALLLGACAALLGGGIAQGASLKEGLRPSPQR